MSVKQVTEAAPVKKRLWSVREVAEFLGISQKTVWRWLEMGKLPKARRLPGRTIRWEPSAIEKWLEKQPAA